MNQPVHQISSPLEGEVRWGVPLPLTFVYAAVATVLIGWSVTVDAADIARRLSIADALKLAQERNPSFSKAGLKNESARLMYLKTIHGFGWVESFNSKMDFKREESGDYKKNIYSDPPNTEQTTIKRARTATSTTSWNYKRTFADGFETEFYTKLASNQNKTGYSLTGPASALDDNSKYRWLTQKYTPELGINLTLPIMGKDKQSIEQKQRSAELAWHQAGTDYDEAKMQLVFSVSQSYYDLLKARAMAELRKKVLEEAEARLDITQKRLGVGLTTELAVSQAELAVLRNKADLTDAVFSEQQSQSRFNSLIGLPLDEFSELTDSFPSVPSKEVTLKSVQGRVVTASNKLKRINDDVDQASIKVDQARRKTQPTLALTSNLAEKGDRRSMARALRHPEEKYSVGLTYEFPFGKRVMEKADLDLAQADLSSKVIQRDETSQSLVLDATETYQELSKARERLSIARQSTGVAKRSMAIAQAKYEEGKAEITDVIQAKEAVVNAQVEELNNLYTVAIAIVSLEQLTGGSL